MRFGVAVPSYGEHAVGPEVRDLVVAAEELGFASAWFPDHIAVPVEAAGPSLSPPFFEPLASCAYGLAITKRIVLGTDILVGPYRHPLLVAAMAATMGHLAGDRLVLGVGIGYLSGEFAALNAGPYEERAARTEAFLRDLRSPPDGTIVLQSPAPVRVWVGGNSFEAERRAALLGDGWHPLWTPAARYADAKERILTLRREAGLDSPSLIAAWPQPYSTSPGRGVRRRSDRQRAPSSATSPRHGWPMTTVLVSSVRPTRWRLTSVSWRMRASTTWCCDLDPLTFDPSSASWLR